MAIASRERRTLRLSVAVYKVLEPLATSVARVWCFSRDGKQDRFHQLKSYAVGRAVAHNGKWITTADWYHARLLLLQFCEIFIGALRYRVFAAVAADTDLLAFDFYFHWCPHGA